MTFDIVRSLCGPLRDVTRLRSVWGVVEFRVSLARSRVGALAGGVLIGSMSQADNKNTYTLFAYVYDAVFVFMS